MKAMIFAAGIGSRLRPLTDHTPKALIKVNGVSMLERVILKLKSEGVSEIIINVHYLANQIIEFLEARRNFGIRIEISDESDQLMDTGGGLKKASWFFDDQNPFILYNVDIMSNIDLKKMLNSHRSSHAMITLAVRERKSSRYFLFNQNHHLAGWENTKNGERMITKSDSDLNPLAFSGIHIINPEIFKFMKTEGPFSIIKTYLQLSESHPILAFHHDQDYWFDIGKPENLETAETYLNQNMLL